MKRGDIIRDIHGLDTEMAALEEQYGLLSDDFYHFYRAGELEQTRDFIRWAGFYEAKQERETSYRQLIYEHLRELRRRSGLGALALDPAGADRAAGLPQETPQQSTTVPTTGPLNVHRRAYVDAPRGLRLLRLP